MSGQPGTFAFVFTDIEGSTRLVRALGPTYPDLLAQHDRIIREAAAEFGGYAFGSEGDAQFLAFGEAGSALAACARAQRLLAQHDWPEGHPFRVRMGVHAGEATRHGDDFGGLVLHETARIAGAGHGGQVLVSAAARELASQSLPDGTSLRDLGEYRFKDLDEPVRVYQLAVEGLASQFPPLKARPAVDVHLPTQLTEFVGRAEAASVAAALGSHRIVTLTGPGGTGKTRLALEVAATTAGTYADGTYFVALDGVVDADLVPSEVATTLGLTGGTDAHIDRIIARLRDRSTLLVLDNMEQVIEAADSVARLVRACDGLTVLATSRIPLRVYGELEFAVPALSAPPPGATPSVDEALAYESVQLFATRAAAIRSDFSIDDGNLASVVDIVQRLDGLPLAIELAAARLRMMPLEALRTRLDDRLGTLTGGARDLPGRQQTLRGAIEWSHDLLDDPERHLFARLGVVVGGAPMTRIEQICGPAGELGRDLFATLESLVEQSLVRLSDEGGTEGRYGMLATIREYARERLDASGESELIGRRHAEAYLALAEEAAPELTSSNARVWTERLDADHDDIRAALDWIIEAADAESGLRMVIALWRFWQVQGHLREGQARAERILALPGVTAQPPALIARAEAAAGGIAYWRSDPTGAHRHYSTALAYARQSSDQAVLAEALYNQGFSPAADLSGQQDRYLRGQPYFEEALELYRQLGDRSGEASALWALHQSAGAAGDSEAAERLGRETLGIARESHDRFLTGWAAYTLGLTLFSLGQRTEGLSLFAESLDLFVESGDMGGVMLNLAGIAQTSLDSRSEREGWLLFGAAQRIRDESGLDILDESVDFIELYGFREPTTPDEHALVDEGRSMTMDEAVALARDVVKRKSLDDPA